MDLKKKHHVSFFYFNFNYFLTSNERSHCKKTWREPNATFNTTPHKTSQKGQWIVLNIPLCKYDTKSSPVHACLKWILTIYNELNFCLSKWYRPEADIWPSQGALQLCAWDRSSRCPQSRRVRSISLNQTHSYHPSLLYEEQHNTHMLMHHNTICNMLGKCQGHTLHMTPAGRHKRTCILHLTKSSGTTAVCVVPQLRIPPKPHRMKYFCEPNSQLSPSEEKHCITIIGHFTWCVDGN